MATSESQRIVERVAEAARRREDELVARMLERFASEAPASGVRDDPDIAAAMRQSAHANLRAALAHLVRGGPPLPFGPPQDAIEEARAAARAGMPLDVGLQTYRIGQAVVWDAVLDAVEDLAGADPRALSEALRVCARHSFAYVDAVVQSVTDEYIRERDRRLRGREQRRVQLVRDVLGGEDVDDTELGYDLRPTHRAVVAWGPGADAELGRLAAVLRARVLVVAVSDQTSWGWLGAGDAADDRSLRAALTPGTVGLAFGRPAVGPDGFRGSHQEARSAHRIGVATGDPVTWFDDVALESVLLADPEAARTFVATELSVLDGGHDGRRAGSRLRETLSAYFACGFNASAAAAMLGVNDRTIAYRLRNVEELLGRPVRTRHTELQVAIRLERVLEGTTYTGP